LYSCGQDRSIRLWERGEDLVFVEEERERALEAKVDKAAEHELEAEGRERDEANGMMTVSSSRNSEAAVLGAAAKSIESVKGGEMLMGALDLVESELAQAPEAQAKGSKQQYRNPMLLGLSPYMYMLRALRNIKAPDLEQALLVLPFHYVTRLIGMLIRLVKKGLDVELCAKCAVHLLRCHQAQLLHTHNLLEEMLVLKDLLSQSIGSYRSLVGVNMAGVKAMKRRWDEMQEDGVGALAVKQTVK